MVKVSKTMLVQGAFMLVPGAIIYAIMKPQQQSPEEQRAALEAKYGTQISKNQSQREAMQQYFDKLKKGDAEQEERMRGVLTKGKDHVVRHFAYEDPKR